MWVTCTVEARGDVLYQPEGYSKHPPNTARPLLQSERMINLITAGNLISSVIPSPSFIVSAVNMDCAVIRITRTLKTDLIKASRPQRIPKTLLNKTLSVTLLGFPIPLALPNSTSHGAPLADVSSTCSCADVLIRSRSPESSWCPLLFVI